MKQMLKPFVVIVLLTTIFVACKKGVEDNPPVNKLTASFSVKGDGAQGPCTDTFMVTSTGAERYKWNFGDGSIAMGTDKTATHLYNGSFLKDTNYIVTLVAYAGKDSATATKNVLVKQRKPIPVGQMPTADFSFRDTAIAGKFESPCTIIFTNTSKYGVSYSWDFGNGVKSNALDTIITYTLTGTSSQTFNVMLTANNSNGSNTKTIPITINPKGVEPLPENVNFSWAPLNPKVGDTVTFIAAPNITHAAKYIWQFNDGSPIDSSDRIVKHVYNTAKDYVTTLSVRNNAGNKVDKGDIISILYADPEPSFSISAGPYTVTHTITFTNSSKNAISYKWDFGDGTTSTSSSTIVTHEYMKTGKKTITLTAINNDGVSKQATPITIDVADVTKLTITNITITKSPLHTDDGTGRLVEWDDPASDGDKNTTPPDFFVVLPYNKAGDLYTSSSKLNQENPSWDKLNIIYNVADFSGTYEIVIKEKSAKGMGMTSERLACNRLIFKPGDYLGEYLTSATILGKSPYGEDVTITLTLKWE